MMEKENDFTEINLYEKIDFIAGTVRKTEKMALLAEELDELADAAEIFRNSIQRKRSSKGRRYTMSKGAEERMVSEMADVMAVLMCTFHPDDMKDAVTYAEMQMADIKIRTGADLRKEVQELMKWCKALRVMAFKRRRINSKDNPTDRTKIYVDAMIGMILPVLLAEMFALIADDQANLFDDWTDAKIERWYNRLIELQGSDVNEQE